MKENIGRHGGKLKTPEKGDPSPNPKGRGKGHPNRETIARKWLDVLTKITNPETKEIEPATVEDKVMLSLISKALKGNARAIELVFEMKYGKITQPIDLHAELPTEIKLIRTERHPEDISESEQQIKDREGL
jgi:hypothetical protein